MTAPEELVRRGYDAIAERYAEWAASFESPALRWVPRLPLRWAGDPCARRLPAAHVTTVRRDLRLSHSAEAAWQPGVAATTAVAATVGYRSLVRVLAQRV